MGRSGAEPVFNVNWLDVQIPLLHVCRRQKQIPVACSVTEPVLNVNQMYKHGSGPTDVKQMWSECLPDVTCLLGRFLWASFPTMKWYTVVWRRVKLEHSKWFAAVWLFLYQSQRTIRGLWWGHSSALFFLLKFTVLKLGNNWFSCIFPGWCP